MKNQMKNFKTTIAILSLLALTACQGGENRTNIELIQDMMEGPQIKTQEGVGENDQELGMRVPPVGTVSRQFKPYPFEKNDIPSADTLKSPLGTLSAEEIEDLKAVGAEKYQIYCGVCHGEKGLGNGPISKKMLKMPPNLTTPNYVGYSDGRLYNVVTNGWGLMGGYGSLVPQENERWAIVNYVRTLQGGE
jgi:mono/diheme cytochrome c family protein